MRVRTGSLRRGTRLWRFAAVAFAAVFVMAGCDSDDGGDTTASANGDNAATDAGGELSGDPIRIGVVVAQSGPVAAIGERAVAGAQFWLEDVGEKEGILGRPVELIVKDSQATPEGAQAAARELIDQDNVTLVIGPYLSGETGALIPLFNQNEVFSINQSALPDAGDPTKAQYMFQIEFTKEAEGPSFVAHACEVGIERLGILVVDSPAGTTTVDAVKAEAENAPCELEIVADEFMQQGALDATAQVANLSRADIDGAIVNMAGGPDYITALKAMESAGLTVPILGNSSLGFPEISEGVPGMVEYLNIGAFTSGTSAPLPPDAADWRDRYREYLGVDDITETLLNAETSYDSLQLIKLAAEGAGSLDTEAMVEHLEGAGEIDLIKATYRFSADNHSGLTADEAVFVQAGTFDDGTLDRI